jgi:hypothetical protein
MDLLIGVGCIALWLVEKVLHLLNAQFDAWAAFVPEKSNLIARYTICIVEVNRGLI